MSNLKEEIKQKYPCLIKNKHQELKDKFNAELSECFCENCKQVEYILELLDKQHKADMEEVIKMIPESKMCLGEIHSVTYLMELGFNECREIVLDKFNTLKEKV